MQRSKISLIAICSLILNTAFVLQPIGIYKAEAAFPGYNGSKILIQSNRDGNNEIYLMDADGSNPVNLTNNPASDTSSVWSPDGSKITFASNRDGNNEIYVMDVDGGNLNRLTNDAASDLNPYWSPDGTKVGFQSTRSGSNRLWYMDVDGSNPTCITCDLAIGISHDNASWSPLGDRVAFQINGTGNGIFTVKLDGTEPIQLSTVVVGNAPDQIPRWTPDGQRIVFTSPRNPSGQLNEIYIIGVNGSSELRLTNNEVYDNVAHVSPDGTKIGFTRADDLAGNPSSRDPWIMNLDGSGATRLFQTGFTDWFYGWQPVGNKVPVATQDNLTTTYNTAAQKDVLINDSDEEALVPSHLSILTQPSHGSASIEAGKVKYTPANNYVGTDELTYQICDSFMLDQKCASAVLSITVQPAAAIAQVGDKIIENGLEKVVTSSNRPTFSGTATPGSTVKVEIHSDPIILTTIADAQGNWTVTPDHDLPVGDHTVYISATLNGITTQLDSFILGIQQTIPSTGASTWPMRALGSMLVLIGFTASYWQRKRLHELKLQTIPRLF